MLGLALASGAVAADHPIKTARSFGAEVLSTRFDAGGERQVVGGAPPRDVTGKTGAIVTIAGASKRVPRSSYHHGDLPATLLDAAKLLIAERGVEGFTLREVARRIGVTHVATYRHFADRRALLAAVAERGFQQLRRRLDAARRKAPDSLEKRLRAILAAYLQFCWDEPALTHVMFGPRLSRAGEFPRLEAAVNDSLGIIAETVAAHASPRALRHQSARHLGIVLWTFVHGFATLSYDKAAYPTARQAARAFDDALTPMLVGMFGIGHPPTTRPSVPTRVRQRGGDSLL